jgi:hypothetical protein
VPERKATHRCTGLASWDGRFFGNYPRRVLLDFLY